MFLFGNLAIKDSKEHVVSMERRRLGNVPHSREAAGRWRRREASSGQCAPPWCSSCLGRAAMRVQSLLLALLMLTAGGTASGAARADGPVPPPTDLPQTLSLEE